MSTSNLPQITTASARPNGREGKAMSNPWNQSPQVEVVVDELTEQEKRDRLYLERKVERAFYEAGFALKELRDRRLYRSTHKTFEQYCRERFGFKRRHPYRLIDAALVVDHLVEMCPDWTQILPTTEYQVRALTSLEPFQQRSVWHQAVDEAGGKVPSGRIVSDIVQRIRERTVMPNPYRVGEVCSLIAQNNLLSSLVLPDCFLN